MADVVIAGAGAWVGGVPCAFELRRRPGCKHRFTLIGSSPFFESTPSNPWVTVGSRKLQQTHVAKDGALTSKGVDRVAQPVTRIEAEEHKPTLANGAPTQYEQLVIATGPKPAFEELPGLGPAAYTPSVCRHAHPQAARDAHQKFLDDPGPAVVGAVQGASCFGPAYDFARILVSVTATDPKVSEVDEDARPKRQHTVPFKHAMMLPALRGVDAVAALPRRGRARWLLAGIIGAVCVGPVAAAQTLQQAWAVAVGRDPGLAALRTEAEAAAAHERAARGARWPTFEANAGYSRYARSPALDVATPTFAFRSPPIFDNDDMVMGGARLSMPLWSGGALSASIRAARYAREAAEALGEQAVADLKLEVAERYIEVLRTRRALATAQANVASLEAHLGDVEAMFERELVAQSDLLAARVALANAQQQLVRADNAVQVAHAAYNRHLGEPLDRVPEIEDRTTLASLPEEVRDLEELLRVAASRRSEIRALEASASALEARARAERGRLLPQVSIEGSYQHLENRILDRQDFTSVGVGLRWSLFDGGQTLQRARALERSGRAARYRRDDLVSQLELQVREAFLGLAEAQARRVATREAVAQAEENLRISRELYGAGLASNTEVLEAIALRVAAVGNRDAADLDGELARLRLARAIGEL